MSSWTYLVVLLIERQLAVEKAVCFATFYAHRLQRSTLLFLLSQFKMVRLFVSFEQRRKGSKEAVAVTFNYDWLQILCFIREKLLRNDVSSMIELLTWICWCSV